MHRNIVFRTDASRTIGSGHIMRCLALAEAWRDSQGEVFFVSACDAPSIEDRLKKEGMSVLHIHQEAGTLGDAYETIQIAHEYRADWIVVDGYHFGAEYQKKIKDAGLSLLFVDDFGHSDHYYADIVLNQNGYADISLYPRHENYTQFLLGTNYAIIRKEFLGWDRYHRTIPDVARKILVTLGGGDPDNVTGIVIEALKILNLENLEVIIVAGGLNHHYSLLEEMIIDNPHFTLKKNVENMPELMEWADIVISAGGSTCWELAFMGVPAIIIILADNQQLISQHLEHEISYVALGWYKDITRKKICDAVQLLISSPNKRSEISKKAQKLVDGKGPIRIIQKITDMGC